jgi:hypothetical protein
LGVGVDGHGLRRALCHLAKVVCCRDGDVLVVGVTHYVAEAVEVEGPEEERRVPAERSAKISREHFEYNITGKVALKGSTIMGKAQIRGESMVLQREGAGCFICLRNP